MNDSGGGAIVNVSSVSGLKGDAELAAYDASKGAVRLLSKEVALFCASRNYPIRCNSVHPGVVETPMVKTFLETMKLSDVADWTQPIGRLIRPAEVAGMIAWLSSSAASLVTGSEFTIDGGAMA
jgi:NAD(P)-dependent dehydrogenase (short-subunit alcohol dehydrogenase family)